MALVPDTTSMIRLFIKSIVVKLLGHNHSSIQTLVLPKGFSRLEEIAGDVQRTIRTTDPLKADADTYELYLRECDRLAETFTSLTSNVQKSVPMLSNVVVQNLLWLFLGLLIPLLVLV
jgi:hypothetical protein